jgi:hypothetical protein
VVAPPVGAPRVVPHRWGVFERCNPSGSAADAGHDAAARVRGSARAADDGVVYVPPALHGSPRAPPITAQRVARFDHYRARNCLPPQKLHERYSRYTHQIFSVTEDAIDGRTQIIEAEKAEDNPRWLFR